MIYSIQTGTGAQICTACLHVIHSNNPIARCINPIDQRPSEQRSELYTTFKVFEAEWVVSPI